mgnify:CR=1 FL=1
MWLNDSHILIFERLAGQFRYGMINEITTIQNKQKLDYMAVESDHSKKLIFRAQPARNPARGAILKKSVIIQAD